MNSSDAYSSIKALMEKNLLAIQRNELFEWLERLQLKGQITQEESKDLLVLADQLKIYDSLEYEQCIISLKQRFS